jgi:hypothetical protein
MARKGKVTDSGTAKTVALIKRFEQMGSLVLMVGVYGDKAAEAAEGGSGLTVGEVAAAHEFSIPAGSPRTWLRGTLDEAGASIIKGIGELYKQVILERMGAEQALRLTGMAIVGKIQLRIAGGIPPQLDDDYLRRKLLRYPGATTPLIASGQFRGSITSDVFPAEAAR